MSFYYRSKGEQKNKVKELTHIYIYIYIYIYLYKDLERGISKSTFVVCVCECGWTLVRNVDVRHELSETYFILIVLGLLGRGDDNSGITVGVELIALI